MKNLLISIYLLPIICVSQNFKPIKEFYFSHYTTTEAGIKSNPKVQVNNWTIGKTDNDELVWLNKPAGSDENDIFLIDNFSERENDVVYTCKHISKKGRNMITVPVKITLYKEPEKIMLEVDKMKFEYFRY